MMLNETCFNFGLTVDYMPLLSVLLLALPFYTHDVEMGESVWIFFPHSFHFCFSESLLHVMTV